MNEKFKKLAQDHWEYVAALLESHGTEPSIISTIGFHYKSSFIHGFKHGVEECKQDSKEVQNLKDSLSKSYAYFTSRFYTPKRGDLL